MYDIGDNQGDIFLTPAQASKILNVSLSTLKKFIYSGQIKSVKTPGGHHRIRKKDLMAIASTDVVHEFSDVASVGSEQVVVEKLLAILENTQKSFQRHAVSVANMSLRIAENLGFGAEQMNRLRSAALLHDIGFIGLTRSILSKPYPLNAVEYSVIKSHPLIGEGVVNTVVPLQSLSHIIRQHHERCDGNGYPDGLSQEEICQEAKVIALTETFDCMTSKDSYRKPFSKTQAFEEIERNAGYQFDPDVVNVFLKAYNG